MRCSQPEGRPNVSLSAVWKASFKQEKKWNVHRPELQHCSNFMWKQGAPAPGCQGTFPPVFREWPSGEALPSDLLTPLSIDKRGCLAAGWSLYLPLFLFPEVLSRLPQRSLVPAWLGTSVLLHSLLWGNLNLVPSTVWLLFLLLSSFLVMLLFACEVCPVALKGLLTLSLSTQVLPWVSEVLEECGVERLGNGEGWRWDNRWRRESLLEAPPHGPVCLVTHLAHTWKSFLAESCEGKSKIQGTLALKYCQEEESNLPITCGFLVGGSEFTF